MRIADIYPLTPLQSGLVFHSTYAAGTGVYVGQTVLSMEAALNTHLLQISLATVVNRHPALRTSVVVEGLDEPVQVVIEHVDVPVAVVNLCGISPDAQTEVLQRYLRADRQRGFDLRKAPLMRLLIVQVTFEKFWCVWTHHHVILDGWSAVLVLKEVAAFYSAMSIGRRLQLPPARPYSDYVHWLQRQDRARAEAFWRDRMTGLNAAKALPGMRGTVGDLSMESEPVEHELHLSLEVSTALRQWAAQQKLTLNTVMQGLWAVLLSRYSEQTDVVFGVTVAGRPPKLAGVESMVGLFINVIPARVRVGNAEPFAAWLRELQQEQVDTEPYEHASLIDIQRWSGVPSGQPLFESLLVFENYPVDVFEQQYGVAAAGAETMPLRLGRLQVREMGSHPLVLTVAPGDEVLLLVRHHPHRFEPEAPPAWYGTWECWPPR